jgi:3-hydroxymyristoyl/3-hydroxydecanoyl-(acyl carrier protein) dehydratase
VKYSIIPLVLILVGCAQNSGIIPMGGETYMVSRQAATGFTGMGTLKAEAMREAYTQCQKSQKIVKVLETIDANPPFILGNFPKTEVRFKCVNEA